MVKTIQLKEISSAEKLLIIYDCLNRWYTGRIMSNKKMKIVKQAFKDSNINYVDVILVLERGLLLLDFFNRLDGIITDYEKNNKEIE